MTQAIDPGPFLSTVRPILEANDVELLIRTVNERWRLCSLCRLLKHPNVDVRKVTAIVIGYVGDLEVSSCLAQALRDDDPVVNRMAEHGLWSIWFRSCTPRASEAFGRGMACMAAEDYAGAAEQLHEASRIDPSFAEAYNQCAIAHYLLEQWQPSIDDCRKAIDRVPHHFGAWAGMGHSYAHLDDLKRALSCYRHALAINPHLHAIRRAVDQMVAHTPVFPPTFRSLSNVPGSR
ncbi:MAG: tetratricopeptide repeat protein [Phycisphaeraceae bacterium]|nr:tetratricopeptide repeat protein [Phycisphaeraceae bacterium]